ncbi:MAG: protein kinase [Deltaproteobacteria bacterium]|nr:protein kinase [Deltaproteobacteria bacterium]
MTEGSTSSRGSLGAAVCPKCGTGYRLNAENLGHRSICVKCGQNFHLLPRSSATDTRWLDTTAELNRLAGRVWEKGLDLRVGQVVLGVYVVQEILGRGGLGQVFKVRHQEWQRELALKLPYRNIMEPKYFQSLKNEAETWVALGLHPHVVTCHYVRPLMGVPSIFMEYISGGSVKALLDSGLAGGQGLFQGDETQRTARALDLAVQAAWGLEYAHGRGVLHLDIKPQNLLLEEDTGRLLVTDFGLARAARDTGVPSDSASLWPGDQQGSGSQKKAPTPDPGQGGFGTPQYMSPEASEKGRPSAGFDLWALSLTVLELFLGRRPWEHGGSVGVALDQYVASQKPVTPVPGPVMDFLRRALNADQSVRYQKASDYAKALIEIYGRLVMADYPRPKPFTTPDSADNLNNRAVSLLDLGRPDEAEKLWRQALKEEPGHLWAFYNLAVRRFHNKTLSAEAFRGQLDDLLRLASGKSVPELPLALSGAYLDLGLWSEASAALDGFSGPAMAYEARRLREILDRMRRSPSQVERSGAAHPRLSMIAAKPDESAAERLLPPLLKNAADLLESGQKDNALAVLKEARRLPLASRSKELDALWRSVFRDFAREELKDVLEEKLVSETLTGGVAEYGEGVLMLADKRVLRLVKDPAGGAPGTTEVRLSADPKALAVSRGAAIAAALTDDGHLWLFNPLTGAGAGQARAHSGSGRAARFRPDGRRLYTAGDDGELKMWDTGHGYLDKGTPLLVRKLSDRPLTAMALTPNCRLLSVTDGCLEYRLPVDKATGPVRTLPMSAPGAPPKILSAYAADPFNRYLVSAHQDGLTFHPLFDTDWRAEIAGLDSGATALAVSQDARLWAVALADGRLIIGLAPDERQKTFLPLRRVETGHVHHLSFAPDNTHLLAVGRHGAAVYGLDWNLEPASPRSWDKKSDAVMRNFVAKNSGRGYTDALALDFAADLADGGLVGHDPKTARSRLRDAMERDDDR